MDIVQRIISIRGAGDVLLYSVVAGALFALICFGFLWSRWTNRVASPNWDIGKSWVSNLALFVTALGAIAGMKILTGDIGNEVATLGVFFGMMALVAPIAFAACSPKDGPDKKTGAVYALIIAGAVTMCAAVGQLLTIITLILPRLGFLSHTALRGFQTCFWMVLFLLSVYAIRSLTLMAKNKEASPGIAKLQIRGDDANAMLSVEVRPASTHLL